MSGTGRTPAWGALRRRIIESALGEVTASTVDADGLVLLSLPLVKTMAAGCRASAVGLSQTAFVSIMISFQDEDPPPPRVLAEALLIFRALDVAGQGFVSLERFTAFIISNEVSPPTAPRPSATWGYEPLRYPEESMHSGRCVMWRDGEVVIIHLMLLSWCDML
jgi:hypothetical protein